VGNHSGQNIEVFIHERNQSRPFDDDPTGSQTVHSCLLLTRWDVGTLLLGLNDASPLMFVLTNTRGMDACCREHHPGGLPQSLVALQDLPVPGVSSNRHDQPF
jgi:hypothetical protein